MNSYCKIFLDMLNIQRRNETGQIILVKVEDMTVDELNYSICHFRNEDRHADKEYPPVTTKLLVLMLHLYLQSCIYIPWDELPGFYFRSLSASTSNVWYSR